ncbi:TIGR02391 family protein [Streptomyces sp. NBC_00239]|uniref:TIGR02391 family protein n=1 Tax=Streptomyces sp. NBC_00239 TaxID=2903640 RepID=UPI002E2ABFEB|nr:TIGR02391 family protein [Streptomyces sp. NBC_00239]
MTTNTAAPVSADALRTLPTPELGMLLLADLVKEPFFLPQNIFARARMAFRGVPDAEELVERIGEAWAWLQSKALVSVATSRPSDNHRVTKEGRELIGDPAALRKLEAAERLAGPLHPDLDGHVRTIFNLGEYETACFAAMKAVEVAVRNAAGLENSLVGVNLMRAAFRVANPQKTSPAGPLTDQGAEGGEQDAMTNLFAAAMGAFKNPPSHRTVVFDDAIEAAEIVQFADLLLRLVERAKARGAA